MTRRSAAVPSLGAFEYLRRSGSRPALSTGDLLCHVLWGSNNKNQFPLWSKMWAACNQPFLPKTRFRRERKWDFIWRKYWSLYCVWLSSSLNENLRGFNTTQHSFLRYTTVAVLHWPQEKSLWFFSSTLISNIRSEMKGKKVIFLSNVTFSLHVKRSGMEMSFSD